MATELTMRGVERVLGGIRNQRRARHGPWSVKPDASQLAVGLLGCALAVGLGAAAASNHGVLFAGALVVLASCGAIAAVYVRDPVVILIGFWVLEVFNAPLSVATGYGSRTEEVSQIYGMLVLLLIILTVWRAMQTSTRLAPLRLVLPGVGVALFGVLGAMSHHVPFGIASVGAWQGLRIWIVIGVTLVLPWKPDDVARVYTVLTRVGVLVVILGFADYLTHSAVSRALHTTTFQAQSDALRGNSVHSVFSQPGEYSLFVSLLFALTFTRFAAKREKSDLVIALLFAVSAVLSLRLKGFLSLAAVVIIVALAQGAMRNHSVVTSLLVGSLFLIGGYSVEGNIVTKQISTYTTSETTVRAHLYATGERIATDDFPLGAGFGRFASYASRVYYSPVYYQYGLSSIYGLSRAFPEDIDDTSWPSVIGEAGYAGLVVYMVGLILLVVAVARRLRTATVTMKWVPVAALCTLAVVLVDSLGDSTLFNWMAAMSLALVLGPALIATQAAPEESEGSRGA